MYPNDRWRKYMMNLWSRNNADHRLYLARYLCREWNAGRSSAEQLVSFEMTFMLEPTVEAGRVPTVRKVALWDAPVFLAGGRPGRRRHRTHPLSHLRKI